jgi:hypothetical protein
MPLVKAAAKSNMDDEEELGLIHSKFVQYPESSDFGVSSSPTAMVSATLETAEALSR